MPIAKGPQAFARDEFLHRIARTKARMAERGIDTLFVVEHANLIWLSGYEAESAYVEQSLVLDRDHEEPLLCVRKQDAPAAIYQSFMDRSRIIPFPERLIANPDENGYDYMVERMRDEGIVRGTVGIEMDDLPASSVAHLKRLLRGAKVVDSSDVIKWLRLTKSEAELAIMRRAGKLGDEAMMAAIQAIRPGVREVEAAAAAAAVLIRGGTQFNGFNFCTTPLTGTSHISWSDHVYAPGSQTNIELGGTIHRYCSGLMRTVHVGRPPDRLVRLHAAEVEGLAAGLEAAKTGNTCADVANAFHRAINKHGFQKDSRCGYAMGINWTETTASLKPEDRTVLEPNMTFHLMLGNWIEEDFGYTISETFAVTDKGGQVMSSCPRNLFVIDA